MEQDNSSLQDPQDPSSRPSSAPSSSSSSSSQASSSPASQGATSSGSNTRLVDEEPVVARFKQKEKPIQYGVGASGAIERLDNGKKDFAANYFEYQRRAERIDKLLKQDNFRDAHRLQREENIDSTVQELAATLAGRDPLYETDGTEVMSPQVVAERRFRLYGDKLRKVSQVVDENQEEIQWKIGRASCRERV